MIWHMGFVRGREREGTIKQDLPWADHDWSRCTYLFIMFFSLLLYVTEVFRDKVFELCSLLLFQACNPEGNFFYVIKKQWFIRYGFCVYCDSFYGKHIKPDTTYLSRKEVYFVARQRTSFKPSLLPGSGIARVHPSGLPVSDWLHCGLSPWPTS